MVHLFMVAVMVAATSLCHEALGQDQGAPILLPPGRQKIYFTDAEVPPRDFRTKIRPSCVANGAESSREPCQDDAEYDTVVSDYIKHLIRQDKMVDDLVSNPDLKNLLIDVKRPAPPDFLTTRNVFTESPVCDAQETLIYPKRAQSSSGDWVFVVNQEGAQQAIKVEKCINEGRPCKLGMVAPGSAVTTCRQKYVYRRMLTLNTNKLLPEEVIMPSCCVCYASTNDFEIEVRFGKDNGTVTTVPPASPSPPPVPGPQHQTYGHPSRPQTSGNNPVHYPSSVGVPSPNRSNRHAHNRYNRPLADLWRHVG